MDTITKALESINSLEDLNIIITRCQERMKTVSRSLLKPGTNCVIGSEDEYDLHILDLIWYLPGDTQWSSNQSEPFYPNELDRYFGRKVEHIWGTGVICKMTDGKYGIRVQLPCELCDKGSTIAYIRPGCHRGAFCYAYDRHGKFQADLRNQSFTCRRHKDIT